MSTPARLLLIALAGLALGAPAAAADDDDDQDPWALDARAPETAWPAAIGLPAAHALSTGAGTTVAVLDTGVADRHPDLGDRVVAGFYLTPDADGVDHFGHGAHMTGLVAGDGTASGGAHAGAAPGARVVSVKVAGPDGATDVSSVLAGLEWIAAHRVRYGIRVVSLSYGTDASSKVAEDPLNFAVQRLRRLGVVVVVAAGNRGEGGGGIDKPADDPRVITVGAADVRGTASRADDVVAPFSSRGPTQEGDPKPDLVAPGVSLVSHRAPGSLADALRPEARVNDRYFKGSGSSQATALVSGVAALMLSAAPEMTPAEVKAALVASADPSLRGRDGAGAGLVDAHAAVRAARSRAYRGATATGTTATGRGSIDASRGGFKPYAAWKEPGKPEQVSGDVDALGTPWDAAAWTARAWTTSTWAASPWAAVTTVAAGWSPAPAPARTWAGMSVAEGTWSIRRWGAEAWTIRRWGSEYWTIRRWGTAMWHGMDR